MACTTFKSRCSATFSGFRIQNAAYITSSNNSRTSVHTCNAEFTAGYCTLWQKICTGAPTFLPNRAQSGLNPSPARSVFCQIEAALLEDVVQTKVIAIGIGRMTRRRRLELNRIASEPLQQNVILVRNFASFDQVTDRLREASCSGL